MGKRRKRKLVEARLCEVPDLVHELFEEYFQRSGTRAVEGYEVLVAFLAAWTLHIEKGVRAVALLQANGLSAQAAPLRRSLLEHAITCFTVAAEPGAWDAALRAEQQGAKKLLEARRNAGIVADEEAILEVLNWEVNEETKSLSRLAQAKAKFETFGEPGALLYVAWLEETGLSHPSPATASMYLRRKTDDGIPTLVDDAFYEPEDWRVACICADALLLALESLSSVTEEDPLKEKISDLHAYRNELMSELEALS